MPEIVVLLFLAIAVVVLLLPVLAWLKASAAAREVETLRRSVQRLESELRTLTEAPVAPAAPAVHAPEPGATPVVSAATTVLVQRQAGDRTPAVPVTPMRMAAAPAAPPPPIAPPPIAPPPFTPAPFTPAPFTPAPTLASAAHTAVNWERLFGGRFLAWIGGFVLFLGVVFLVKYSFDNNLISPQVRVAMGFLTGVGLLGGGVAMKRREFAVTAQTLCATGTLILYATTFACRAYYEFINTPAAFALMVLITATAFTLAVRLEAMVVAILGLVGGFLTPPLLSTGVDRPLALFGYIALLDLGLLAVAMHRRWHYLVALAAAGTVLTQIGWASRFFEVDKVFVALAVFLGFNGLFLLAWVGAKRWRQVNAWWSGATVALPFLTLAFTGYLLSHPSLGARPGVVFSFILGADLCLLAIALLHRDWERVHVIAGTASFLILAAWTVGHLTNALLPWGLGAYLFFAALHAVVPVVFARFGSGATSGAWGHLFPVAALLLTMVPLFKDLTVPWLFWPAVLMIDVVALGLALVTASLVAVLGVVALTAAVTLVWILRLPQEVGDVSALLLVLGGFGAFFFVVGSFVGDRILARLEAAEARGAGIVGGAGWGRSLPESRAQIPGVAAVLPFLLLILATARLPLANPSPVYGLALLLVVLLLGVARILKVDLLAPVALACTLGLELAWFGNHFTIEQAAVALTWNVGFASVFVAFPFVFRAAFADRRLPWIAAALAGPVHYYLVHQTVRQAYPNEFMGLLPALFAVPMVLGLVAVLRHFPAGHALRTSLLAWFGGSALFFITLVFPVQFDRQWITLGWAFEGLALIWWFQRVPHPGLRLTGVGLLWLAFVRLALNPAILQYHERQTTPILNWFLYTYGLTIAALFLAARWLRPPHDRLGTVSLPAAGYTLGTVLAFYLLNLEIADYFSTGRHLTFDFSVSLGRDMTYSIAWALFAFVLLVIGIRKRLRPLRYASLGLLTVTLIKLFFHDLGQLQQLYRIGALVGVALVLMVASYLYQRFFASDTREEKS